LNAIRGWAYVLRRCGGLDETQLKALDAIDRNTRTQANMVDDLLDSQRILYGNLRLNIGCVALAELIDTTVRDTLPSAHAKHIRIDVAHDPRVGSARVDVLRLAQALSNLLNNAVKFTPDGGHVQVRSARRQGLLAIEVQDTGVGLDPAQLAHVFDRFRQADGSTTRRHGGLGLGLSLARQIVELHGGRIGVQSAGVGHGSTFIIELPGALMSAPAAPLAGKRIVMVEDDDDAREVLELILRDAQAEPRCFDRAAQAYSYLAEAPAEEQPDALISDIAMPDEDGYQFIKRVREMEGRRKWRRLAALALTSFSRTEDRLRALSAGFDAHLAKPIDSQAVVQTLIATLRGRMSEG
jgi:CheY-like chemotaxis protein